MADVWAKAICKSDFKRKFDALLGGVSRIFPTSSTIPGAGNINHERTKRNRQRC
jgi:hypothetical protein